MPDHIQISFPDIQPEQQEILIAHLADIGFESFEEKGDQLNAFIPEQDFDEKLFQNIIFKYKLAYQKDLIPEKNWNAVWESQFQPVIIDDFVGIRADFHPQLHSVQQEIIITPKMSFGTGHHATTRMMIRQMREVTFENKTVLDFGTGTGILAILAMKLGAKQVTAIDNDDWSIENAGENFNRNDVEAIHLTMDPLDKLSNDFDIILANINKNVILDNLGSIPKKLNEKGILLISGILQEDEPGIIEAAGNFNLKPGKRLNETPWACLRFDR